MVQTSSSKPHVILTLIDTIGGVNSWAYNLRSQLHDHPDYTPLLLNISSQANDKFDLNVPDVISAYELLQTMGPIILVPNYAWSLYRLAAHPHIDCLGIAHSDSEIEYYRPLSWYEPFINQFIAVSPEIAVKLRHRLPHRAADITMLPYGVTIPPTLNRNYQTQPLRLIYAGRLIQTQKRVLDFVPLVANLLRYRLNFHFDIVGDGPAAAQLRQAMSQLNHQGRVQFWGRVPAETMPQLWANHDIFVQVSDYEGTSVSLLEAMAQGTVPVVTAASSGVRSVIRQANNGLIAPVGDMETLAGMIAGLANQPYLLPQFGQAAYKTAQQYALDTHGQQFVGILDQIKNGTATSAKNAPLRKIAYRFVTHRHMAWLYPFLKIGNQLKQKLRHENPAPE